MAIEKHITGQNKILNLKKYMALTIPRLKIDNEGASLSEESNEFQSLAEKPHFLLAETERVRE